MRLSLDLVAATAAVAVGLGPASHRADARISIVYEPEASAGVIFTSPGALTPERGGYRQDPGVGGVFREGMDSHRVGKIEDTALRGLGAQEMAALIRRVVDETPSGLVAIDEIGNRWRDPKIRPAFKWGQGRGTRLRVAAHNDVVLTETGYRVVRREQVPPVPHESHPGMRLSAAMQILAGEEHPAGGSYASRVHMYVAPAMVTAVGEGRGAHYTLDATGSISVRPAWRGVVCALARAGGVWLEMYHGSGEAVSARVWRAAPARFARYLRANGGTGLGQLHFLITASAAPPAGPPGRAGARWCASSRSPAPPRRAAPCSPTGPPPTGSSGRRASGSPRSTASFRADRERAG